MSTDQPSAATTSTDDRQGLPERLLAAEARRRTIVSGLAGGAVAGIAGRDPLPRPTAVNVRSTQTVVSPHLPGLLLDADESWHLARRACLNPTAEVADEIRKAGPRAWVDQQLAYPTIDDSACQALVDRYFSRLKLSISGAKTAWSGEPWKGAPYVTRATLVRQVFSKRRLYESMVELWGDLLYVPFVSDKSSSWVAHFDTNVIRPYALGRYRDMLRVGVRHPAMLMFLDNQDNSAASINENLGRELLELFSVGTGSYTEDDVKMSSRILTGHGIDWTTYEYLYRPTRHYVGPVKVMGFSHANATAADGPAVLDAYATYLARHPATAARVARRIAVRFVSDTPSPALVKALTDLYLANDTDVRPMLRYLFTTAEFQGAIGAKIRRPNEVTIATLATGRPTFAPVTAPDDGPWSSCWASLHASDRAGHGIRAWPAVNGYPDVAQAWSTTTTTLARFYAAHMMAYRWDQDLVPSDWVALFGIVPGCNPYAVATAMVKRLTGFTPSREIRDSIASMLWDGGKTQPAATQTMPADRIGWFGQQAVALALCTPYLAVR